MYEDGFEGKIYATKSGNRQIQFFFDGYDNGTLEVSTYRKKWNYTHSKRCRTCGELMIIFPAPDRCACGGDWKIVWNESLECVSSMIRPLKMDEIEFYSYLIELEEWRERRKMKRFQERYNKIYGGD